MKIVLTIFHICIIIFKNNLYKINKINLKIFYKDTLFFVFKNKKYFLFFLLSNLFYYYYYYYYYFKEYFKKIVIKQTLRFN